VEEFFYKVEQGLLRSEGYIHPDTGECIKMSLPEKMIYSVLKQECQSFSRNGLKCYLSQGRIASMSGASRATVNTFLSALEEAGVIHTSPHKGQEGKYTKEYTWLQPLSFYGKEYEQWKGGIKDREAQALQSSRQSRKPIPFDVEEDDPFVPF